MAAPLFQFFFVEEFSVVNRSFFILRFIRILTVRRAEEQKKKKNTYTYTYEYIETFSNQGIQPEWSFFFLRNNVEK